MKLFDRDGFGAQEIVAAIGLISSDITFDIWEPLLSFGIREVAAITGREPIEALSRFYMSGEIASEEFPEPETLRDALKYLQKGVAFFTWLRIIPTLDAQHDGNGRQRRLGENEKGLSALQEYKDEQNILRLAYEAVDALIAELDAGEFPFWTGSRKYRLRRGLLLRSKEEFDEYYNIGSHRLFVTLLPIIREVQGGQISPILGDRYSDILIQGEDEKICSRLGDPARRALALLTMQKAIERLPVEVIPEGVVQVQISQPVKSRLKAEREARNAVAASLGADGERSLRQLQDIVAALDGEENAAESSMPHPLIHSRGMTF